mgnify:CR=1 FL=1
MTCKAPLICLPSLNCLLKEYKEEVKPKPKRRFIIRQTIIDKFNTVRRRVLLTPSMCTRLGCTFDAASKFGGWENAPESQHAVMRVVLIQHDKVAHNSSEDLIVDEEDMPKEWIGNAPKHRGIYSTL